VSWAYSAANERAPVSTAHAPSSRIVSTPWRIPRALRGSGTSLNASALSKEISAPMLFLVGRDDSSVRRPAL